MNAADLHEMKAYYEVEVDQRWRKGGGKVDQRWSNLPVREELQRS
jgi:hypothetical protein